MIKEKIQEIDHASFTGHLVHPKYRSDIDGLRAVAVLSVVAFHAFPEYIRGGFVGVDIFFVISGFLISTIIFGSLERNSFGFVDFYSRRVRRIFPALLTVLVTSLSFGWFVLLPSEFSAFGKHVAAGAGFISNFVLWRESGYFDMATETKPLLHLWSLGIEEQFYIVWPLFLWWGWKQRFNLLTVTIVVAIISFSINLLNFRSDSVADFYSPGTRFWELLVGALLSYVTQHNLHRLTRFMVKLDIILGRVIYSHEPALKGASLRDVKSILGGGFVVAAIFLITKEKYFPGVWALLPTFGAALIISAGQHGWVNRFILANRLVVWFGVISFPLYLWHWPLLSFARIVEGEKPNILIRFIAVTLSIVFAWLTFAFIERPIRFGGWGKLKTVILFVFMVVVAYAGYSAYSGKVVNSGNELFESRIKGLNWPDTRNFSEGCVQKFGEYFSQYCLISNLDKDPAIVLLGDSNANHLYPGLSAAVKDKNILMLGKGACLPFVGLTTRISEGEMECQGWVDSALQYVESTKSVKTVILSMMGAAYINKKRSLTGGFMELHRVGIENDHDKSHIFVEGMRNTLHRLVKANKEVIFVISTPRLDFSPATCIESRPFRLSNNRNIKVPCAIDRNKYEEDSIGFRTAVAKVLTEFPQVKVFDPADELCDINLCWASKSGKILYRDDVHLSYEGSQYISSIFAKKFLN